MAKPKKPPRTNDKDDDTKLPSDEDLAHGQEMLKAMDTLPVEGEPIPSPPAPAESEDTIEKFHEAHGIGAS